MNTSGTPPKTYCFCTVSTRSHRFKTEALQHSLAQHSRADFKAFYTDSPDLNTTLPYGFALSAEKLAEHARYKSNSDAYRWSLKSLIIIELLNSGYTHVVYLDNDFWACDSPDWVWEALSQTAILLTPHHYPIDPTRAQNWLEANFQVGLYNAGFVGATAAGLEALTWWRQCCLYACKKSYRRGLFDDQKYLDLLPVAFENVRIAEHRGLNVAGWNTARCPRNLRDGKLCIAEKWPLVFIHFNPFTIQTILRGNDPLLMPFWNEYAQRLMQLNPLFKPRRKPVYNLQYFILAWRYLRWKWNI